MWPVAEHLKCYYNHIQLKTLVQIDWWTNSKYSKYNAEKYKIKVRLVHHIYEKNAKWGCKLQYLRAENFILQKEYAIWKSAA